MNSRLSYGFVLLVALLLSLTFLDLFSGATQTKLTDLWNMLLSYDPNDTSQFVLREFRLPRTISAILAGASLSVCGLLMQTLFNNPLAGPYVLGISNGSSLSVALGTLTGWSLLSSNAGTVLLAFFGSILFGLIVLILSSKIRSHISLLLAGLMLGSTASAIITALEATSTAQELRAYTIWTMGSLSHTTFEQLPWMVVPVILSLGYCIFIIKPLNALLLGEDHARLLGIRIKLFRAKIIIITAILTAVITAFCGPIAFIGLAVPNLCKMLLKTSSHGVLLIGSALIGGTLLVLSDLCIQWLQPWLILPLNAFTTIIGAPIILILILKRWT